MAQVFVVSGYRGDYSYQADWFVVASMSEERAKKLTDKLNELTEWYDDVKKKLYADFEVPYLIHHPKPVAPEKPKPTEEWLVLNQISKKNAGDDVRSKWKKLDKAYKDLLNAYNDADFQVHQATIDWSEKMKMAQDVYREEKFPVPEHLREVIALEAQAGNNGLGYVDASYSYEGVELV